MPSPRTIKSMTGYAAVSRDTAAGRITLELRSINSRFLDLVFRMPDELRAAEPGLRELVTAGVARGKVECRIALQKLPSESRQPAIDRGLLAQLLAAAGEIGRLAPQAAPLTQADLMRWPGVLAEALADPDAVAREVVELGRAAVAELATSRLREGEKLAGVILERADRMQQIVEGLRTEAPALLAAFEQRLVERLRAALGEAAAGTPLPLDQAMDRVRQEVVLYGLRIDIAEELSRLSVHIDELRRIVSGAGPVGKRLDFLLQELNREANTLGSKAANIDLTNAAVELKLLIEQIREQVQNLE
ncbi:MAG TPA: YicC/YloC family endoribonuclease [Quisquiliibacterium sp.]|nr:YicC/YloC family endoribonuclease [Quisquiliibacterium sp.]